MRISDWSSDVCSSDLSASAIADLSASVVSFSNTSFKTPPTTASAIACGNEINLKSGAMVSLDGTPGGAVSVTEPLPPPIGRSTRSEEHTSELQSLMRISYAVFCLKKKIHKQLIIHL